MKHIIATMAMLILITSSEVWAQKSRNKTDRYKSVTTETFEAGNKVRLVIDNISSDVDIDSWDSPTIEIREEVYLRVYTDEEAEEVKKRIKRNYVETGSSIRIRGESGYGNSNRYIRVMVPRKFDIDVRINWGDIRVDNIEGSVELHTSLGTIDITNINGDIDIESASGDLEIENIIGMVEATSAGGDISLENITDDIRANTAGGNITCENASKNVSLQTAGGRLRVFNVGGDVIGQTSGGDIRVHKCVGEVQVQTSGGDIDLRDLAGGVYAQTSGGDVVADDVFNGIFAQTSGGDIDLDGISGSVEASTSAGDIKVVVNAGDYDGDNSITLETSAGLIELVLPANFPADIDAILKTENTRWKSYEIHSDFPLAREESRRKIRLSGQINGGGDRVYLHTNYGSIYIRKR